MACANKMARFHASDLYVVITEAFCGGRPSEEVLDAVLDAGITLVQLREKDLDARAYIEKAILFRDRTLDAGALLIVNDRMDIALAIGADGVHLGQSDLPIEAARGLSHELLIGASTHSLAQALGAQAAGADYVNIGPIFPTQTKELATGIVGPEMIDTIAPHLTIPFSCMGGIKLGNIDEVLRRGARHPAVVTAVTSAPDVRAAAEELRAAIADVARASRP